MLKRLRFWGIFVKLLLFRYYRIFGIGLLLGGLFFWYSPRLLGYLPSSREVQKIGLVGRFNETNLPVYILARASMGMTQINEDGSPYPGIASSWKADKEGKNWTFTLTDELAWSDGTKITAYDINYQFKDVVVEVIDEKNVRYTLPDPFAPFSAVVSRPIFKGNFIGTGPYKLKGVQRSGDYLQIMELTPVTRNTTLPNILYSFYPTEEAAKLSFKLGEIDQIVELIDPSGFEGWPNVQLTKQVKHQRFVGIYFNHANEELKQKPVRQALAYALTDKSFSQERAISSIPAQNWAHNPNVKTYDYDLERAKTLLKDYQSADKEWVLNLTTVPNLLKVAEQIAADWKQLGITTNIQVANTLPEQFDVLLITQEVPSDPDQYSLWHSTQPTNIISYRNPKIDKLLEDGRKTIDREERKQVYMDFQRFLNEDLPVIFLYHPSTYTITRTNSLQIPLLSGIRS